MESNQGPQSGVNAWLEEELLQQYHLDRSSVDSDWKDVFDHEAPANGGNGNGRSESYSNGNGHTITALAPTASPALVHDAPSYTYTPAASEELMPLRGAAARIAENMALSASIPLATSQRIIPVKVIDENRRLINHHRTLLGGSSLSKPKVSYTHIIGWAIVKSVQANPGLNHAFAANAAGELFRVVRKEINFGLAIDVPGKNGSRSLLVPNIKNAGAMSFAQYLSVFDDLVARARSGKLAVSDFEGTSISLTNPGTVGTMASMPRLVAGQGAIVAVGAMDYPAEYRGAAPDVIASLGISKVMSVTCTYDHRIIQGAESGLFLGTLQSLLDGEQNFYEEIFEALRVPYAPVKWAPDKTPDALPSVPEPSMEVVKEAAVIRLLHAFRVRGHLMADLDPLGDEPAYNSELDPLTYGLTIWDLDRYFYTDSLAHAFHGRTQATLREMIDVLRETYCGKMGAEYMYIQRPEEKIWLQERMESPELSYISKEEKLRILDSLTRGEEFEHFLDRRFIGQKRFSLEGAETTISVLTQLADLCADDGAHEMVIGMAHRGRLNVLANIIGKPLGQIFSEFEGNIDPASAQGSGDVKYHLGASGVHRSPSGREVVVSLAANPSHLEAVNPVVEGMVRAKQDRLNDQERLRVVPLLVHGDAAFAGQGVVAETLNLSQLDGYCTGGTIHFVINNQIGFTTLPEDSRSTAYATDIARTVQAPIIHVNGDDPEATLRVVRLAFAYRRQFRRDVVIDMICYRRHGHNEGDDPAYTQPVMYRKIKELPSVAVLYEKHLAAEKIVTTAEVEASRARVAERLNAAFDANKAAGPWVLHPAMAPNPAISSTAISRDMLERVVDGITFLPSSFHIHPKLEGFIRKRRETLKNDGPVDWAFAEAIAFGSLVLEGIPVRLSGQDSGRGTFSQRHLAFYDFEDGHRYIPLQHMAEDGDARSGETQAHFNVFDSSLSEFGVLGFEYGYSVSDPRTLTLWEAQFGDFSNGAQVIIDQFITTAEQKWGQLSGLVMLLPHGYEGQGPEHSSARMERFLLLCAEDNIRVANCSTPAQYFHILRRQMAADHKPLVLFTPKSLLRLPAAVSSFSELTSSGFRPVIGDTFDPSRVRKVVFCTGKVYYDLAAAREAKKVDDIALVRIEELYPFPEQMIVDVLARYSSGAELIWCQEEPRNMGAWRFMSGYFKGLNRVIHYAGRMKNASPAAGSHKRHAEEQQRLIADALK
ncbi:MAG TPA: multifunctional oxoglutarate decarboxylase/oxoglutarate dehydrogenase thiamine pyrophosphate-binding subunit/dihydrolipoyllysine-residue succinyltransferase subunit [Bryobacteraceae bacterium]|jgi:2-oxoglutarate dehydrogenase E1 component|nr:multifunctional oxoglutarate decarboxylase/oxoglutarate dehydrogenase thiamine pyrophosphate-binding subunit/dihydrolipoyllysine-residue succinyltransferase subunit [Bryobacteraceae bacterium]